VRSRSSSTANDIAFSGGVSDSSPPAHPSHADRDGVAVATIAAPTTSEVSLRTAR
jgi:hypothetical protein